MAKPNSQKQFAWVPATDNQRRLRTLILEKQVTFVCGPPGTGKTFVSVMTALELLNRSIKDGGVDKIIAVRPIVTAGKPLGYFPGDLDEKVDPYMQAIYDTIIKSDHPKTQSLLDREGLMVTPLEVSRGLTFDDSYALLDEAQNTTVSQMELFLTRLGPNSKAVISGDLHQKDFAGIDGLSHAIKLFSNDDAFGIVHLTIDDIQRAGIVRKIVLAYAADREEKHLKVA